MRLRACAPACARAHNFSEGGALAGLDFKAPPCSGCDLLPRDALVEVPEEGPQPAPQGQARCWKLLGRGDWAQTCSRTCPGSPRTMSTRAAARGGGWGKQARTVPSAPPPAGGHACGPRPAPCFLGSAVSKRCGADVAEYFMMHLPLGFLNVL